MTIWSRFYSWLQAMFHRSRLEREMAAELRFHIEERAADLVRSSLPRPEALRRARLEFGAVERVKEESREARGVSFFDGLFQDARYGLRLLRKSPGFTAVAVLTLALGIGANTAIFSLINAVMLHALPVSDPQGLVLLRYTARKDVNTMGGYFWGGCTEGLNEATSEHRGCSFSHPMYEQIHARQTVLAAVSAFIGSQDLHLAADGQRARISGGFVSGDFFSTVGVRSELGRMLEPGDDQPGAPAVGVLRYGYWRNHFGANAAVIGKTVSLEGVPVTIIGVAGGGFSGLDPSETDDIWLPLSSQPVLLPGHFRWDMPNSVWAEIVARLKPGVSKTMAESALTAIFAPSVTSGPNAMFKPGDAPRIELPGLAHGLATLRQQFSGPLLVLTLAVGIILLLTIANISGLLLARAAVRRREIAVRFALGGRRSRILRQLLTESLLMAVAAAALGTLLAYWASSALASFLAANWRDHLEVNVNPDPRVLGFTIGVTVVAAILFGLAPSLLGTRLDLAESLKGSPGSGALGSSAERSRLRLGSAMVVVQVALSVVLVAGAGLLVHTLVKLETMNVGFDTHNLLLVRIDPNMRDGSDPRIPQLCRDLQARFAGLPAVTSATYSMVPLLSKSNMDTRFAGPRAGAASAIRSDELPVGTSFFETMHIPLLAGRTFAPADFQQAKPVPIIVNQRLARLLFGTDYPIGRLFSDFQSKTADYEVIGLVADAKYNDLRRSLQPTAYVPLKRGGGAFELRTAADPRALIPTVRAAVSAVSKEVVITEIRTQVEEIDRTLYQERLITSLFSLFGILALVLACVGLYGLLAYEVTRRTHEIGLRMALGATYGDVARPIVRSGVLLTGVGVVLGLPAAVGLTRYLESFLYGVRPLDPLTYAAVTIVLAAVAVAACWIPTRRAARVDPIVALRYE